MIGSTHSCAAKFEPIPWRKSWTHCGKGMRHERTLSIARQKVEEASDFYEEQREGLGHEFILAFEKTLDDIQLFPELGSKIEQDCRRRRFKKFRNRSPSG
jgi:hypothetical protein